MNTFFTWAMARASEPSTYAGIAAFVAGLTFLPTADISVAQQIVGIAGTVIPGILAIVMSEAKK
jgi:hypothetical protein